jgi:hypothetical protein
MLRTVSLFVSLAADHILRSRGIGDLPSLASETQRRTRSHLTLLKMVPTTEKQGLSNISKKKIDEGYI